MKFYVLSKLNNSSFVLSQFIAKINYNYKYKVENL